MGWYQRRVLFFFFFFFFFGQSLNFYLFLEPLTRTHKSQRTDNGDYCTVHTSCTLRRDSRELEVEPTARHPSNIQQKASTTHSYSMQDSGPRMNSWPLSRRVLSYCVPKERLGWPKASNRAQHERNAEDEDDIIGHVYAESTSFLFRRRRVRQ